MFPKWNIPYDSKNGIIRCVSKMEYSIRFQLDSKNGIICCVSKMEYSTRFQNRNNWLCRRRWIFRTPVPQKQPSHGPKTFCESNLTLRIAISALVLRNRAMTIRVAIPNAPFWARLTRSESDSQSTMPQLHPERLGKIWFGFWCQEHAQAGVLKRLTAYFRFLDGLLGDYPRYEAILLELRAK